MTAIISDISQTFPHYQKPLVEVLYIVPSQALGWRLKLLPVPHFRVANTMAGYASGDFESDTVDVDPQLKQSFVGVPMLEIVLSD